MSGRGGGGDVKETPEQKELATIAANMAESYEQDWAPLVRDFISDVRDTGREQRLGATVANTETMRAFGQQQPRVEASQAAAGAAPGSGRFNSAVGLSGIDRGEALGSNLMDARQAVDDQRVSGLRAIAAMGRGEQASALQGLTNAAALSGQQARMNAEESAENRAGLRQAIGTAAGIGYGAYRGQQLNPMRAQNYAIGGSYGPPLVP